ncbi:MAG TPA: CHASE2 domain-containing protein, partial [Gammaproteobacteria bacterium]|nr:CHASE2 domain-containing protein [Gammaproteobacteria bacterium]
MNGRLRRVVVLGLGVGALGVVLSMLPSVLSLEEHAGLAWLFAVRGPVPPPKDVAVVSIDGESADELGLTSHLDRWPRALHADLIDRLSAAGAAVIAFDVMFDVPREPDGDQRLATAIETAGNVVLLERVQSETVDLARAGGSGSAVVEHRVPPIEPLDRAALATGPFTLPVVPIRVGQFWAFGRAGGNTPTLPVAVLHGIAQPALDDLIDLAKSARPNLGAAFESLRHEMHARGGLARAIRGLKDTFRRDDRLGIDVRAAIAARDPAAERRRLLDALVDVYAGPDSRYLSYYGPARTIDTISYYQALERLSPAELARAVR